MNERKINSVRAKIDKIKKALAADKRNWGGQYDDSRGLRYLSPEQYLKIQDYSGALRYFNWFQKNFPDDLGYPDFLFEWTVALYKCGKFQDAEKKVFSTYFSNTHLINKYFNEALLPTDTNYSSNLEHPEMIKDFHYSSNQTEFLDFSHWLKEIIASEKFVKKIAEYTKIKSQLETEPTGPRRSELVGMLYGLRNEA